MSFSVQEVVRQGARLLIQLSGTSGSGKTYSALQLAYGLAGGDASKVVGIDTENRRMSLMADILPGKAKFKVINFFAPFSPSRYIQAIEAACNAGAEVIVIDSVTHEWESEGGCQDIANATKFPDWKKAKGEHKRFMTYMLQCPAHVIVCTRARNKTDFSDPKKPVPLGLQPIQEENFSYEATVSLMMHDKGARQDVLKCPAELVNILGRGTGYITPADGEALRQWINSGEQIDQEVEHHRGMILNATERGVEALKEAWGKLPKGMGKKLGEPFLRECQASAAAWDKQRAEAAAADAGQTADDAAALNQLGALTEQDPPEPEHVPEEAPLPEADPARADEDDDMFGD